MKVVVTAGPTREYLDPVRFLSNPSTGKMGFAVAAAAAAAGHETVLISGPVSLKTPPGVRRIDVVSAREMLRQTLLQVGKPAAAGNRVVVIGAAAVADLRPRTCSPVKIKKSAMGEVLRLVRNPDILKTLGRKRLGWLRLVGFAAETGDAIGEASRKCREKKLSFVVGNDVTKKGAGFAVDTNEAVFVFPDGSYRRLPLMSKRALARLIVKEAEKIA